MAYGGVSVFLLAASFIAPAVCAALAEPEALSHCAAAMSCFAAAEAVTRAVRASGKPGTSGGAQDKTLGAADIAVIGIIALYAGTLWTLSACAGSALCAVYCRALKKRRAAFVPFLTLGAIISVALCDMGIMQFDGGLLCTDFL
jgi:prepilin signal peptidase PulO-like enzyme (type II secretory pathway)